MAPRAASTPIRRPEVDGRGSDGLGRPRAAADRAAACTGAVVEGYLTKRGSGFPFKWQRRYFFLDGATRTLYYYETDGREAGAASIKGEVVVREIKAAPIPTSSGASRRSTAILTTRKGVAHRPRLDLCS